MEAGVLESQEEGLHVVNIEKYYGKRRILKGLSFFVRKGESVALMGPNGAGKTTSFYIVSGIIKPDTGKVVLNGLDITKYPMYMRARMGIGYLPQEMSIFRGMDVSNNIRCILQLYIKNRDLLEHRLDEILEQFSITHIKNVSALSLSGGERRRVEVARALASNPKYILLDEPFAGVDPIAINDLKVIISLLKQKGIGVLITDHNVREALGAVDRGYIVYDGTVLTSGTPEEIMKHDITKQVYLGSSFE